MCVLSDILYFYIKPFLNQVLPISGLFLTLISKSFLITSRQFFQHLFSSLLYLFFQKWLQATLFWLLSLRWSSGLFILKIEGYILVWKSGSLGDTSSWSKTKASKSITLQEDKDYKKDQFLCLSFPEESKGTLMYCYSCLTDDDTAKVESSDLKNVT